MDGWMMGWDEMRWGCSSSGSGSGSVVRRSEVCVRRGDRNDGNCFERQGPAQLLPAGMVRRRRGRARRGPLLLV